MSATAAKFCSTFYKWYKEVKGGRLNTSLQFWQCYTHFQSHLGLVYLSDLIQLMRLTGTQFNGPLTTLVAKITNKTEQGLCFHSSGAETMECSSTIP